MPSLIQSPAGYGLVLANTGQIIAIGNAGGGGPVDGLLQEDGTSFVLTETGDYLVQE